MQLAHWVHFYNLKMPVSGIDVADYLTDLLMDGATLDEIERAAEAICSFYDRRRQFIDRVAIQAAVQMCADQLTPNRVLN